MVVVAVVTVKVVVVVMMLVLHVVEIREIEFIRQSFSGNQGGTRLVCELVRLQEAPPVDREEEEGEPEEELSLIHI